MKIGILLTTSPESQNSEIVLKLASAILDKGQGVEVFFMDDGVYNVMRGNSISPRFEGILKKGAGLALCGHTAEIRGLEKGDCLEGVKYAGQYELSCIVAEADRFLMF